MAALRPKKVVSQDPVHHLVTNGHSSEEVRKHAEFLQWHTEALSDFPPIGLYIFGPRKATPQYYTDKAVYFASKNSLQRGLRLINQFLVDVSSGEVQIGTDTESDRITAIVLALRAYLGFAPDVAVNLIGLGIWTNIYMKHFLVPNQDVDSHRHWEILTSQASLPPTLAAALAEYVKANVLWRVANTASRTDDYYKVATDAGDRLKSARQSLVAEKLGLALSKLKNVDNQTTSDAEARADEEVNVHLEGFVRDLIVVAEGLALDPILVDSGQFVETYEHPRSFDDVEAEIANELVNLMQFEAHCKLSLEGDPVEFRIVTSGYRPIGPERAAAVDTIRIRAREKYGRPRQQVEEERRQRLQLLDEAHQTTRRTQIGREDSI